MSKRNEFMFHRYDGVAGFTRVSRMSRELGLGLGLGFILGLGIGLVSVIGLA